MLCNDSLIKNHYLTYLQHCSYSLSLDRVFNTRNVSISVICLFQWWPAQLHRIVLLQCSGNPVITIHPQSDSCALDCSLIISFGRLTPGEDSTDSTTPNIWHLPFVVTSRALKGFFSYIWPVLCNRFPHSRSIHAQEMLKVSPWREPNRCHSTSFWFMHTYTVYP